MSNHSFVLLRFSVILAVAAIMVVGILVNLINTTVVHNKEWNSKAATTLGATKPIEPLRGEILASNGEILATNLNYYDIRLDFRASRLRDSIVVYKRCIRPLADSLAKYFPSRDIAGWVKYLEAPLEMTRSKRPRGYLIASKVSKEVTERVRQFPFFNISSNPNVTGLSITPVLRRSYPFGDMAQLSIGRVGYIDSIGHRKVDGVHGISGLEYALDTLLYGTPGLKRMKLMAHGARYWPEIPAVDGASVTTTIDVTIQDIVESELGTMLLNSHADWGTAIVMDVHTGDIKAISNLERDSTSATPRYIESMNHAVLGYEPGSVMKVMTMAVALEKGYALPITKEYTAGYSYAYTGRFPIKDTHSPASLPVEKILEYSSNIATVRMIMPHYENDLNRFREDLREMGFFDRFHTGIAMEEPPHFRTLEPKQRLDLSRMVFGYATRIPPLYTCAFYNAVANDGKFVTPRLVKSVRTPDGRDSTVAVRYVREQMMSPQNAAILRSMMRRVVWEQGGTAKRLRDPRVEIAGKTGTARLAIEAPRDKNGRPIKVPGFKGGYREGHFRVTFCGFFPYQDPRYTAIVVISDPKNEFKGPQYSAGTVLKNIALKMYARGMLGQVSDYHDIERPVGQTPFIYASGSGEHTSTVLNDLRIPQAKRIHQPSNATLKPNIVPDVHGIGLREALVILEKAGYSVDFSGVGYVQTQSPAAGTHARPGSKITLTLRQL